MNIYLASSWRNLHHAHVLEVLRGDGHTVYDFKHPEPDNEGFSWRTINGSAHGICRHCGVARAGTRSTMGVDGRDCPRGVQHEWLGGWTSAEFCERGGVLDHPVAAAGFGFDMTALDAADACVLVEPCGRSAHLELGYAAGRGKLTAVYVPEVDEPELMLRICDYVCATLDEVRESLTPQRRLPRWQRDVAWYDQRVLALTRMSGPTPKLDKAENEGQEALLMALYGESLEEDTFSAKGSSVPGPCRINHHRYCARCNRCWRHGACECL